MFKWVGVFILLGAITLTAFKLVPVYMDNSAITGIVNKVINDESLKNSSKREVMTKLQSMFIAQEIDHLQPKDVVKVARDSNGALIVDLKYEERRKLMYNLEIVAGFDEQFTN